MRSRVARRSGSITFLSPGQRFQTDDTPDSDITVARLVTDRLGLLHVTLRYDNGHEISAFAEQIEAAIADGHLSPVMPVAAAVC